MSFSYLLDTQAFHLYALVVSSTLALILLLIRIPKTEYAKKLARSKYTIATSYMIGAFTFGYAVYNADAPLYEEFSTIIMLIVVAFISIIVSFSLINLLMPRFIDGGKFLVSIFLVFVASVILVESFFSGNMRLHRITLYTGVALFIVQSCSLIIIFDRAYKRSIGILEKYYDEDEEHKIKWIRFCYILTMLTAMFILVYVFLPDKGFIRLYMFFYILYMIYFAGNYISFLGSHKLLLDAVGHFALSEQSPIFQKKKKSKAAQTRTQESRNDDGFSALEKALNKWVKEKRYREYDKSREETAQELGTTKEMLQMYFTDRLGIDFRSWRTDLRIKEAKDMLLKHKDYSINFIAEAVGFSDRSNFHRQFTKSVGCSPKEWRDTDGHPEIRA
ncbi:MAG: AraC family transcriptional regulator [Bacteroidetes bacterium]|uniref:AraC family transcriptional regulator n=1 Tax=Candidatus Cryptobacteroides avicola TaxID=2840757 RepID=A0A940DSX8_9BACT|nr:AraC family transcriptional regulator [Candidatus Cryptobacteroides avicola]